MNISNFITWFIDQFVRIASEILAKLDEIILVGNVSLMDFIITIAVIGAFLGIIITTPSLRVVDRATRTKNTKKGEKKD